MDVTSSFKCKSTDSQSVSYSFLIGYRTYEDNSNFWEDIIFVTFYGGFNYNKQENGESYFGQMYGYIIILVLLILERKSEVWLTNKFGYEKSTYKEHKGKIILERFVSEKIDDKIKTELERLNSSTLVLNI